MHAVVTLQCCYCNHEWEVDFRDYECYGLFCPNCNSQDYNKLGESYDQDGADEMDR